MSEAALRRELGVADAAFLGLGAILGSGVFVSVGLAAGVAGPSVLLSVSLAALLAAANALNSAQLAAAHPVSGGTYEYGHRWLTPALGFSAGWMFLCAKSASAATAALGFAGYLSGALGFPPGVFLPLALGAAGGLTLIAAGGLRPARRANLGIVSITLLALTAFIALGAPVAWENRSAHFAPFFRGGPAAFFEATALMFVAYTGYARVATLGEEARAPRQTIPRAILLTLAVSFLLYAGVTFAAVGANGADALAEAARAGAAPLEMAARRFGSPWLPGLVALGALTATLGVLLNLLLGLSRVALAMARRGDAPRLLESVRDGNPRAAVFLAGGLVAALVLIGEVKTVWSFSAFSVLIYYAVTNLCALRMSAAERMYPKALAWAGLGGCLFLAFFIAPAVWAAGLGLLGLGLAARFLRRRTL